MNCNQVFNILTRGPFPSGDPTDAAVRFTSRPVRVVVGWPKRCGRRSRCSKNQSLQKSVALCQAIGGNSLRAMGDRPVSTASRARSKRRGSRRSQASTAIAREIRSLSLWQIGLAMVFGLLMGLSLRSIPFSLAPPKGSTLRRRVLSAARSRRRRNCPPNSRSPLGYSDYAEESGHRLHGKFKSIRMAFSPALGHGTEDKESSMAMNVARRLITVALIAWCAALAAAR